MTKNLISNVLVDDRGNLTLRQLREILPSTKGISAPSAKWFKEHPSEVFCCKQVSDAVLAVYCNGFYTYSRDDHTCVLRVDGFNAIRYNHKKMFTDTKDVPEEAYLDEPFVKALAYRAELRYDENAQDREKNHQEFSIDGCDDDWNEQLRASCFLEELEEREYEYEAHSNLYTAIKNLTERQKQVIFLYFYKHKTQKEIAANLGIGRTTVEEHIAVGIASLKETLS